MQVGRPWLAVVVSINLPRAGTAHALSPVCRAAGLGRGERVLVGSLLSLYCFIINGLAYIICFPILNKRAAWNRVISLYVHQT